MNNYDKALKRLQEIEGKAFWQHIAIYAAIYALLSIADAIRELKDHHNG